MHPSKHLCSVSELHERISKKDLSLIVLDGSWYLPSDGIDTQREFDRSHIPTAVFFDIDSICDQQSDLPHMLPSAAEFAHAVGKLGVHNDSDIVIYDTTGLFSAARVWWMFKVFGHNSVRVLDGGLPAWIAIDGNLSSIVKNPIATNYKAMLDVGMVKTKTDLIENIKRQAYCVLDARPTPRFLGNAPEPRPGLPSGHMPESISLPFKQLLNDGYLKSPHELRNLFHQIGIDGDSSVITSCGSGVTAAIITLALAEAGFGMYSLYDGAWAEWGSASDTIILTG